MPRATTADLNPSDPPAHPPRRPAVEPAARRLQRMGSVTMGVSLPREWVHAQGLGLGSPVVVEPRPDGALLVRGRPADDPARVASITVRVDRPREHLFRRLVAAYLDGAREFHVTEPGGLSPETRAAARAFVRRTVQPEIVSEEGSRLHLRDVSRGEELALAPLLRRMHQVVQGLHASAVAILDGVEDAPAESWANRDDEVDRYAWLVERILTLRALALEGSTLRPFGGPAQVRVVVRSLERIADHALLIAEHGTAWAETSPPARLVRSVAEFHAQALTLLAQAFAAAEAGDADTANDLLDTGEALHAQHRTLVETAFTRREGAPLPPAGAVALALTLQSVDRTVAYAQDIAEAALDAGVRLDGAGADPSLSSIATERGGQNQR